MYYIVKKSAEDAYSLLHIAETTDATYHEVKKEVLDIQGQFGREDYAQAWCDFHNNKITREELKNKLDAISYHINQ